MLNGLASSIFWRKSDLLRDIIASEWWHVYQLNVQAPLSCGWGAPSLLEIDADGASDVVAADGTNVGVVVDADGEMVTAVPNGVNDGEPAVVATDTRWDDTVDRSSSAAFRTSRAPATGVPCLRAALTLVVGFRTKEFRSNEMLGIGRKGVLTSEKCVRTGRAFVFLCCF